MPRIGDVHCHECGDAFEPEGIPSFEGPNFCSDECVDDRRAQERFEAEEAEAYWEARYGGASVYGP